MPSSSTPIALSRLFLRHILHSPGNFVSIQRNQTPVLIETSLEVRQITGGIQYVSMGADFPLSGQFEVVDIVSDDVD